MCAGCQQAPEEPTAAVSHLKSIGKHAHFPPAPCWLRLHNYSPPSGQLVRTWKAGDCDWASRGALAILHSRSVISLESICHRRFCFLGWVCGWVGVSSYGSIIFTINTMREWNRHVLHWWFMLIQHRVMLLIQCHQSFSLYWTQCSCCIHKWYKSSLSAEKLSTFPHATAERSYLIREHLVLLLN